MNRDDKFYLALSSSADRLIIIHGFTIQIRVVTLYSCSYPDKLLAARNFSALRLREWQTCIKSH